jgi:gamma-D-glutamyl-L-lysine dipeptidyl-peptidase
MTDPRLLEVCVPVATLWTRPDAPRDVDASAVRDLPDVAGWAASMDAEVRKGLDGRTLTQLLLGEPVRVLEEHGDWVRVVALGQPSSRAADGYPGWLRRAHLGSPVRPRAETTAVVTRPSTLCSMSGSGSGSGPVAVSFGTALPVDRVGRDAVEVLLPGGNRGTVPVADVRLSTGRAGAPYDVGAVLGSARQFLGLRYLWGGTSAWGLDCSGLVHLTFRAHGLVVPRDAHDQAASAAVEPVALDDVRAGDLYFFARPESPIYHVGFATAPVGADGVRWMLHAPEGGELVEDAPMAPHRLEALVGAGRVRG